MRLDSEQALARFAELLIVEDEPDRILSSAVELIAEQFEAPLVTAVAVARDRTEVEPLAVAGGSGRLRPGALAGALRASVGLGDDGGDRGRRVGQGRRLHAQRRSTARADRALGRGPQRRLRADLRRGRLPRRLPHGARRRQRRGARAARDRGPDDLQALARSGRRSRPLSARRSASRRIEAPGARPASPARDRARRSRARGRGTAARSRTRARAAGWAAVRSRRG